MAVCSWSIQVLEQYSPRQALLKPLFSFIYSLRELIVSPSLLANGFTKQHNKLCTYGLHEYF